MKRFVGMALAGVLLVGCGDDKSEQKANSETDETAPVETLDLENFDNKMSYAWGMDAGGLFAKLMGSGQVPAGILNSEEFERGLSDGISGADPMTKDERQDVIGNFNQRIQTGDATVNEADGKDFSYAAGLDIASNSKYYVEMMELTDNFKNDIFLSAAHDALTGQTQITDADKGQIMNNVYQDRMQVFNDNMYNENVEAGEAFLAENGAREEVTTTETGLQYEVLVEGTGVMPEDGDQVTTHYHGTLLDGTVFDSSVERGEPIDFTCTSGPGGVIVGWVEALKLMKEGSKHRLYIPEQLAYGKNPRPGGAIKPGMTLIFDVELIKVTK